MAQMLKTYGTDTILLFGISNRRNLRDDMKTTGAEAYLIISDAKNASGVLDRLLDYYGPNIAFYLLSAPH